MNGFELVIFDCDGVLIDSEAIGVHIEADLLTASGYPVTAPEVAERFSGLPWEQILKIAEQESGLDLSGKLAGRLEQVLDQRLPLEVEAISGVAETLAALGRKRCVCSNTKFSRVDLLLGKVGLKDFFAPNIFSAKDLGPGRSKPKPDIFLHGAARMGVAPVKTAVVEDSVHGVEAGVAAGMTVIGFTGGGHSYPGHAAKLRSAGASATIGDMRRLPQTLEDLQQAIA
ncbi:HAD family hydrolase [Rhizobium sp. PAMB 3182]